MNDRIGQNERWCVDRFICFCFTSRETTEHMEQEERLSPTSGLFGIIFILLIHQVLWLKKSLTTKEDEQED
jgi:hypothetical protein